MTTPSSASVAYADPLALSTRYDVRFLVQIASDSDAPIVNVTTATTAQVQAALNQSARLLAALSDASGEVEASLTIGNVYSPTDLQSLSGNSQSYLIRLVCDLAIGLLFEGRPGFGAEPSQCQRAREALKRLEKGENVLGILENQQAGYIAEITELANDVEKRQGPVVQARGYFSRRGNQLAG